MAALTFGFFPMVMLIIVLSMMAGRMPLTGAGGGILVLVGGCAVLGVGALVHSRSGTSRLEMASRPRFIMILAFYGIGFGLWFASPFVMVAAGVDWSDYVGSGRYRFSPLMLLILVLMPVVAAGWGAVAVVRQRRRMRRPDATP